MTRVSLDRKMMDEYSKMFQKLEEVLEELKNTSRDLKTANEEIKYLKESLINETKKVEESALTIKDKCDEIGSLKNIIDGKDELIKQLTDKITKLENDNDKDSNNSNRPSGTNG